jgi:hypothetical protein
MTTKQDLSNKRIYSAPKLRTFGDIATLTKAGSGSTDEQVPGQGSGTKKS